MVLLLPRDFDQYRMVRIFTWGNYSFVVWLVSSGPWVVWSVFFFFRDLGFPFIFKSSSAEGSSSI